jgi:hypothetical protein
MTMKTMVLLLAMTLAGCSKPQQVIVLDSWWNIDYAKQWCKGKAVCLPDPVSGVKDFERELKTQFAAQEACKVIKFVQYDGPQDASANASYAASKEHWNLSINYNLDQTKQMWQILNSTLKSDVFQGEDVPAQAAITICNIVNKKGSETSR